MTRPKHSHYSLAQRLPALYISQPGFGLVTLLVLLVLEAIFGLLLPLYTPLSVVTQIQFWLFLAAFVSWIVAQYRVYDENLNRRGITALYLYNCGIVLLQCLLLFGLSVMLHIRAARQYPKPERIFHSMMMARIAASEPEYLALIDSCFFHPESAAQLFRSHKEIALLQKSNPFISQYFSTQGPAHSPDIVSPISIAGGERYFADDALIDTTAAQSMKADTLLGAEAPDSSVIYNLAALRIIAGMDSVRLRKIREEGSSIVLEYGAISPILIGPNFATAYGRSSEQEVGEALQGQFKTIDAHFNSVLHYRGPFSQTWQSDEMGPLIMLALLYGPLISILVNLGRTHRIRLPRGGRFAAWPLALLVQIPFSFFTAIFMAIKDGWGMRTFIAIASIVVLALLTKVSAGKPRRQNLHLVMLIALQLHLCLMPAILVEVIGMGGRSALLKVLVPILEVVFFMAVSIPFILRYHAAQYTPKKI